MGALVIKFFLHPPSGNLSSELRFNLEAVKKADSLGINGFVLPDHYMTPQSNWTLDAWSTLAYFAAATSHIRLGTLVTPIPLRPPQLLAKVVSTIDVLSEGRCFLGVGAGWSQKEFEGYSQWDKPGIRIEKVDEGIALIKRLWTEPRVDFEGKYYRAKGAVLLPKPVQKPYPPLLFGGRGIKMLRLAGKYADICFIPEENPKEFSRAKDEVVRAAKEQNRTGIPSFACLVGIRTMEGKDDFHLKLEKATNFGASYVVAGVERKQDYLQFIELLAKDIMPSFG
jgi:alkanesulfonate monooxygenase SsuD/methylene tetrahydromethanopterin reductase-like flavin-dependent oxidoreductase (luciferase family)